MILGSLLDCGITLPRLKEKLDGLKLSNYSLSRRGIRRHGISATRLNVSIKGKEKRRSLDDILNILEKSRIDEWVRQRAVAVFHRLAVAEAGIHGEKIHDVHFHEVGATDAIVDVVGSLTALQMLGVEEVYSTSIPLGTGFVETRHGLMPLPSPATVALLKDYPVRMTDRENELTTPTGAALISTLSLGTFTPAPFTVKKVGYGAGQRESEKYPNLLRAIICEEDAGSRMEDVIVIEANVDDMDPQLIPHLQEEIARAGALDAYRTPVQMKKNRPGMLLHVLVESPNFDRVTDTIFRESTTIGIRYWPVCRVTLDRRIRTVKTSLGRVRVKEVVLPSGEVRGKPEHDDCLKIAREKGLSLLEVVRMIEKELGK
jgi:uncharacterized protein (TIGR00299 family) protein